MDHFYRDLPGWASFAELYQVAVVKAKGGETFVEVGSWLGRSAAFMGVEIVNSHKDITLVCVDPWDDGGPDLRNTPYYKELKKPVFELFEQHVEPIRRVMKDKLVTMRMDSVTASKEFADKSVDFIMLDGDHSYEGIHADIEAWLPKMKPGAIMAGDDYLWPGVTKSADEQFGARLRVVIKKTHRNYRESVAYWWVQLPQ